MNFFFVHNGFSVPAGTATFLRRAPELTLDGLVLPINPVVDTSLPLTLTP